MSVSSAKCSKSLDEVQIFEILSFIPQKEEAQEGHSSVDKVV